MQNGIFTTPEGLRDYYSGECAKVRNRESSLASLFSDKGFFEISTPILERYELFVSDNSSILDEEMIKVIGPDGRICVLRPDSTAPIARLAATRLQNQTLPLKLWYSQPVFRYLGGGFHTKIQAGAEIIGDVKDLEVIKLAKEAVSLIAPAKIELNHAGIISSIFAHMNLTKPQTETALSHIRRKNFTALDSSFPAELLRLSGGVKTLEEAARLSPINIEKELIELELLVQRMPSLTVDFGLWPSFSYYNGVFFCGYAEGEADAILTGGRYDKFLGQLGRDAKAAGFAIKL